MSLYEVADGRRIHLGGWRRDQPDERDKEFKIVPPSVVHLPTTHLAMLDPFQWSLGVYDQGELGACAAHAALAAYRWLYWKAQEGMQHGGVKAIPDYSRLAQYYWTRRTAGLPLDEDTGSSIRDAIKTLHVVGACQESKWGYDPTLFAQAPPDECEAEAEKHETASYHSVGNLHALKYEIARWYPVDFGFEVFESTMSEAVARTGVIPLPKGRESSIGGHSMLAVGYCDARQAVLCLNSWSRQWGVGGFCWLPYEFWTRGLAVDNWVIHTANDVVLVG